MVVRCAIIFVALSAGRISVAQTDISGDQLDTRLKIQWESADAQFWRVHLRIIDPDAAAQGISEVENLSRSRHTTGAWELNSQSRELTFEPRHANQGGAVQFRVRASRHARLVVGVRGGPNLAHHSHGSMPYQEWSLAEIARRATTADDTGDVAGGGDADRWNWSLARVDGDELRIDSTNQSPVYDHDDRLHLSIRCNALMQHVSRALTLQYSLVRISHGEVVSTHRWPIEVGPEGNSQTVAIDEPVPEMPGVYEVRCRVLAEDENIWSRLRGGERPIVEIGRPIIVLPKKPPQPNDAPWEAVGTIRPSEPNWSMGQWLPKRTTRFIPGSSTASSAPGDALMTGETHAGKQISRIRPGGTFQATLPTRTAGLPHKVHVRVPASRPARIRVDVGGDQGDGNAAVSFVLRSEAAADDTEGWKTHTFVHYPSAAGDQIYLTNLDPAAPAAFESVSVEAGPDYLATSILPASNQRTAAIRLTDLDWVDSLTTDVASRLPLSQYDRSTAAMYRLWVACDRLRDYTLATGGNGVMVPANSGGRAWFASELFSPCSGESGTETEYLGAFLRIMDRSQLDVFVSVAPEMLLAEVERAIREQPELEQKLIRESDDNHDQYNLLHPLVQKNLADLVHEVDQQCHSHSCLAGIALKCDGPSHLQPISGAASDGGTLMLFAQSHGEKLAETRDVDPATLQLWVEQEGRDVFDQWLGIETRQAYEWVARSASKQKVMMLFDAPTGPADNRSGDQVRAFADNWHSEAKNLTPTIQFRYGPHDVLAKRAAIPHQLSRFTRTQSSSAYAAMLGQETDVDSVAFEPLEVNDSIVSDLGRIVDRLDPAVLLMEQPTLAGRLDPELNGLLASFTSMPASAMRRIEPADPAAQTVHVNSGTYQGFLYVSMTSLVPWPSEVFLETRAPLVWQAAAPSATPEGARDIQQLGENRTRILVPPGKLILLKSSTPAASTRIASWSARVAGGSDAIARIKDQVTSIVERIGILSEFESYDGLKNGGFERTSGMGPVGWLHAQYPPGCVTVDNVECIEGNHSVRLTTDAGATNRTWIVSETLEPPRSGRLAVSLARRAERMESESPHRLRVSIEATVDGKSIRFSSEFDVPRNGQWSSRDVVLEADGIDRTRVESLRLTIDSLTGGRVWIDDIQLHDQFPTAQERAELQSQAFLAVQGLQRGNLTPSGRLLQNHWARYLLTRGPSQQSKRVIEAVKPPEPPAPGVAERIRNWLPRPLRF